VRDVVMVVGVGIQGYWGVMEVGSVELGGWALPQESVGVGDPLAWREAGCEVGGGMTEGEPEGVVIPASLVGLLFESYDKGCEAFVVAHSEVEEIFLRLRYGVKDAKLTRELLGESKPIGEHGIVWVEPE
ncbi:hypothetical protein C0989_010875, partial [Termitomyces sp. Mn162]